MAFQARAMRGTRAECANVFAHSICKFEGTDRKHETRQEHSALSVKSQIALQYVHSRKSRLRNGWVTPRCRTILDKRRFCTSYPVNNLSPHHQK